MPPFTLVLISLTKPIGTIMIIKSKFKFAILAGIISTALIGCGGSSTSTVPAANNPVSVTPTPPVANSLPSVIKGQVQDYSNGKLTVNNRVLDIAGASLRYASTNISADALASNMQVSITTNGSNVLRVTLNPNIAGVVTSVAANSISVNGFAIATSELVSGVNVNDYVIVTTSTSANGQLNASALAVLSGNEIPTLIELEGAISNLDSTRQTFTLNEFTIDYASATLGGITLQNGLWVEVFGSISGNTLFASEVDLESIDLTAETEISGVVTWIDDEKVNFEVNQRFSYTISTLTRFEDGTVQDLAIGRQIQVTTEQVNGNIQVTEIEFEDDITVPPSPPSASSLPFDVTGSMTFNANVLSFNGFNFEINAQTKLEDGLTLNTLDDARIEIDGIVRNGIFLVREIERADEVNQIDLEGQVTNGSLWGYQTDDNSLSSFDGQWVSVDCALNGVTLSACRIDRD
jgi:hypothetical protein